MGVRYGHSAEIGSRRVMEDRTVAVNDIFRADAPPSLRSRSAGFFPVLAAPPSPAPLRKHLTASSVAGGGGGGEGDDRRRSLSTSAAPGFLRFSSAAGTTVAGRDAAGSGGGGCCCGGGGGGGGDDAGGISRNTKPVVAGEVTKEGGSSSELATVTESSIETSLSPRASNSRGGGSGAVVWPVAGESGEDRGPGSRETLFTRREVLKEDPTGEARAECERGAGQRATGCVERGAADEQQWPPLSAAFFGVYDGHDGDVVAEALQKSLHKLIAKQVRREKGLR